VLPFAAGQKRDQKLVATAQLNMSGYFLARVARWIRQHCLICSALALIVPGCLAAAQTVFTADGLIPPAGPGQRRALIIGRGEPFRDPDGGWTHPQRGKTTFLDLYGNVPNDPAKGWTCDLSWDLMLRFGLNPTNATPETLFNYLGQHHLGYRIAMNNVVWGQTASYWGCALDNGIMPFAPHYNNQTGLRFDDPIGIRAAVSVAGGTRVNNNSYGQSLEFIDAVPVRGSNPFWEDTAQSWANQALAARFARILDAHPNYNIWDARQHMRQAASYWATGWTETNGYGRVNERAVVGKLLPGPPVEFMATKSRDRHHVLFTWRNFLQTDFAATVIASQDGRILYEGAGTNFIWTSDVNGDASFLYWSKNKAGEKSRMETYQKRTVKGLACGPYQTCLVLGARASDESLTQSLSGGFQRVATNWVCDMIYRPGNAFYDKLASFPYGQVVAVLPDVSAMVGYAITNHYRLLLAPVTYAEGDLYRFKSDWDRATAAGILVVLPHHASLSLSRKPQARRLSPPRLFSAVTVGEGVITNRLSLGPGLEVFDRPSGPLLSGATSQMDAAAVVAGKLARILDANPQYNIWDARQHLRQSSSYYATGWVEDGGYGRPPAQPAQIDVLDPAPPLEIQAAKSADGSSVTLSWQNFLQSSFTETVIQRKDSREIYHGAGTNFVWRSDVTGDETFRFFSKDKSGRLSKPESYTVIPVAGLRRNQ
jgi:hypothetical protein